MKTLIATREVYYNSQNYAAGEEFRAANDHAKTLLAIGFAREATGAPQPKAPPPPPLEPAKRGYRRRDMAAENTEPSAPKPRVMTTQDFPNTKKTDD